jgi:hypothetical protein
MLRHFIWANGLEGVGDAFGVADGFGLGATVAVGVGAGMADGTTLGCGPGEITENIATMSAKMDCIETLLTNSYDTQSIARRPLPSNCDAKLQRKETCRFGMQSMHSRGITAP